MIQDYTIGEDQTEIDMDGSWDQIYAGSMFTDNSGDQIMFLTGISIQGPVSALGTRPDDMKYTKQRIQFQVSNMADGVIYWVNGDEVTQILSSMDGL